MMTAGVATDIEHDHTTHRIHLQIVGVRTGNGLATTIQIKLVELTILEVYARDGGVLAEYTPKAGDT